VGPAVEAEKEADGVVGMGRDGVGGANRCGVVLAVVVVAATVERAGVVALNTVDWAVEATGDMGLEAAADEADRGDGRAEEADEDGDSELEAAVEVVGVGSDLVGVCMLALLPPLPMLDWLGEAATGVPVGAAFSLFSSPTAPRFFPLVSRANSPLTPPPALLASLSFPSFVGVAASASSPAASSLLSSVAAGVGCVLVRVLLNVVVVESFLPHAPQK